jgi:hypothetical protein
MDIERNAASSFVENSLPDGSRVIVDSQNEKVYALNATAGAAWDACSNSTSLSSVTESMRRAMGADVTEEMAESAILQLQEQNLVATSQPSKRPGPSRRQLIMGIGAVAVPLVVSLTLGEQRAHAAIAKSTSDPGDPGKCPGHDHDHDHDPQCGIFCQIFGNL